MTERAEHGATFLGTAPLIAAVVLGGAVSSVVGLLGLPLMAAGLSGLHWQGRHAIARAAAAAAVALGALISPISIVMLAPALVALYAGIARLENQRHSTLVAALAAAFAVGAVAADQARAWRAGTTLVESRSQLVDGSMDIVAGEAAVDFEALFGVDPATFRGLLVHLWPADYVIAALFASALCVAAAVWVARRKGAPVRGLPVLAAIDVTPHVLWGLVVGVLLLAASRFTGGVTSWAFLAGVNLILIVRLPLFVQGLAVADSLYRRLNVGRFGRYSGYLLLGLLELLLPLVSFLGLVDLFANLRKLPRSDGPSSDTDGRPEATKDT